MTTRCPGEFGPQHPARGDRRPRDPAAGASGHRATQPRRRPGFIGQEHRSAGHPGPGGDGDDLLELPVPFCAAGAHRATQNAPAG